jgi:hypothetical protein
MANMKKPPLYYVALQTKKAYEQANFTEYKKAKEAQKQKQRREKEIKKFLQSGVPIAARNEL